MADPPVRRSPGCKKVCELGTIVARHFAENPSNFRSTVYLLHLSGSNLWARPKMAYIVGIHWVLQTTGGNLLFFFKIGVQGADHFYIYVLEVNELVEKILNHYGKLKLVEIIQLQSNKTGCLSRHRCRHEFQLQVCFSLSRFYILFQECLTRARGVSKLVGTVDLDERVVPTKGTLKTYAEDRITRAIGEFRFRCQWVLRHEEIPTVR